MESEAGGWGCTLPSLWVVVVLNWRGTKVNPGQDGVDRCPVVFEHHGIGTQLHLIRLWKIAIWNAGVAFSWYDTLLKATSGPPGVGRGVARRGGRKHLLAGSLTKCVQAVGTSSKACLQLHLRCPISCLYNGTVKIPPMTDGSHTRWQARQLFSLAACVWPSLQLLLS